MKVYRVSVKPLKSDPFLPSAAFRSIDIPGSVPRAAEDALASFVLG